MMERYSDRAIEIINELHTARIDYENEYIPLIDCANQCAAYEDTGMTPEAFQSYVVFLQDLIENQKASEALDRFRQLVKADKEGRLVVLPFTSGRTLLCKENIDSPRLMKDVEIAIRYCSSCGIVFHMGYNVFCDLVKHGRITAVSEEAEKALEAMKDGN
jgi:hypothetical protein